MASYRDLEPRMAALEAKGLRTAGIYKGDPPNWLVQANSEADAYVVNCKNVKPGDTPVVLKLSTLEKLLAQSGDGK